MSITSLSQLDLRKKYSYADYLHWKFQERVELIRGHIHQMSPAPNTAHQAIVQELSRLLGNFFHRRPCRVFPAPFDVRLPGRGEVKDSSTVVQPDLCIICDPAKLDTQGCNGAPDLIIEVLSPGNSKKEMKDKFEIYQESGVREYWLVNPLDKNVLIYVLNEDGHFIGQAPLVENQKLQSRLFPELSIDLSEVFRDPKH